MESVKINTFKDMVVPIFEFDENDNISPNPMFHRTNDKLHSRCVEYPFAASRIGDAKCILDVGTVKSNRVWISWLENLPIEVHATDYDPPTSSFKRIKFHQADVRKLPMPDLFFDKIIAVSVIEHIGLDSPQVFSNKIPSISNEGDLQAVRELSRVLKAGGELIMTLPFGLKDGLILGNEARNYTIDSIKKFESIMDLIHIEYYEYQSISQNQTIPVMGIIPSLKRTIRKMGAAVGRQRRVRQVLGYYYDDIPGEITWRNIPLERTNAFHHFHTEGVVCGVWKKRIA